MNDEMYHGEIVSADPVAPSPIEITDDAPEMGVAELKAENEQLRGLIVELQDEKTELIEQVQQLERRLAATEEARDVALDASVIDSLTGLLNRRGIDAKLESIDPTRYEGEIAIVQIDLDKFKDINDTIGHPAADKVLKAFANFLKKNFRKGDDIGFKRQEEPDDFAQPESESHLGRPGGDEFVLLLRGNGPNFKETIASRLQGMETGWKASSVVDLRSEVVALGMEGKSMALGFSYGFTSFDPELDGSLLDTQRRSDEALYEMKQEKGRAVTS